MNSLVSVILPVYNGKYLSEAIESILNQTYTNFEFIIINDGSPDNSLKIIQYYANNDKRIIIIDSKNEGVISSLNKGLLKATGKYIIRMDHDDICFNTRLEEQVKFMNENENISVCGSWTNVFGDNIKSRIWKRPKENDSLKIELLFSVPFAHPSVIIRKSILDKYDLKYNLEYKDAEDYEFWYQLSKNNKMACISKVLLNYRYLETSISRKADNAKDNNRYNTQKRIFTKVLNNLNITNTEEENKLHFILMKNDRVKNSDIHIQDIENYFNKLITANNKSKMYDKKLLKQFLGKKYLSAIINKKEVNIFKYDFKLIYYYILSVIEL